MLQFIEYVSSIKYIGFLASKISCIKSSNDVTLDSTLGMQSENTYDVKNIFLYHSLKIGISRLSRRKQRFPARGVFYFAAESRGNCIVRLMFNDV
jgi:hypothetical protein